MGGYKTISHFSFSFNPLLFSIYIFGVCAQVSKVKFWVSGLIRYTTPFYVSQSTTNILLYHNMYHLYQVFYLFFSISLFTLFWTYFDSRTCADSKKEIYNSTIWISLSYINTTPYKMWNRFQEISCFMKGSCFQGQGMSRWLYRTNFDAVFSYLPKIYIFGNIKS